jgi:hypothetical protein
VARAFDVAFDINAAVFKRRERFGLRSFEIDGQFFFFANNTHSAPAAARRRFDNNRKTDFFRKLIASSALSIGSGLPGKIGTPAAFIVRRASTLSPIIFR